jgi:hypothetical protein
VEWTALGSPDAVFCGSSGISGKFPVAACRISAAIFRALFVLCHKATPGVMPTVFFKKSARLTRFD